MVEKKSIWHVPVEIDKINERLGINMTQHLDIRFEEIGQDYLTGSMPVDHRTTQPYGILHGGASCVLAETLGSVAGALCLDLSKQKCVGLEINANHIKAATGGRVLGTAKPIHLGRSTHVWEIKIVNEQEQLVCVSRLTLAII